jgi:hypothetical protein
MAVASPRQLEEPLTREPASWAVRSFESAAAFERSMDDPAVFEGHVARVFEVAVQQGVTAMAGVSPIGDRVALAVSSRSGVPVEDSPERGALLLVDGFVNTGIQLALAIRRANEKGSARAVGLGLVVQERAITQWRAAGINLVALETVVI